MFMFYLMDKLTSQRQKDIRNIAHEIVECLNEQETIKYLTFVCAHLQSALTTRFKKSNFNIIVHED